MKKGSSQLSKKAAKYINFKLNYNYWKRYFDAQGRIWQIVLHIRKN